MQPLNRVHACALGALFKRDGAVTDVNTPRSWAEVAKIILDHYQPAAEDTRQLEEAIYREYERFPFFWDGDPENFHFPMAFGQLVFFTQSTFCRAAAMSGNADETFRMLRLGFQLKVSDLFWTDIFTVASRLSSRTTGKGRWQPTKS